MFIDEEILNDKNLNANEKIILFLLMTNDQTELSSDYFIARLGCNQRALDQAFNHLVAEGYLIMPEEKHQAENIVKERTKVIRSEVDYEKVKLKEFHSKDYESTVDELHALIEEPINDRQARIILNIANGDIELIKKEYKNASGSQFSDKLGLLIKTLQKQNVKKDKKNDQSKRSQVNYKSISKLKKYKSYSK